MATDNLWPAQWALLAVNEGWSANQGLSEFRQAGGHIANQTWYRTYAEIAASISLREGIYNEPVNRIPVADEIKQWTTKGARGYAQQVEVLVRDKVTGEIISIPFSLTGTQLRSRNTVIRQALDTYDPGGKSGEGQVMLGAVYTGTYRMVPEGE
jgi:hypothetical protein